MKVCNRCFRYCYPTELRAKEVLFQLKKRPWWDFRKYTQRKLIYCKLGKLHLGVL